MTYSIERPGFYLSPDLASAMFRLFESCFPDTSQSYYYNFVLPRAGQYGTVICKDEGGTPVGAVYSFPCFVGKRPAKMLYGVGVHPEHRGQGLARRMLAEFIKESRVTGAPLFLHPSEESLYGFYESAGFDGVTYLRKYTAQADGYIVKNKKLSPLYYNTLRNRYFEHPQTVTWDSVSMDYALRSIIDSSHSVVSFSCNGRMCAAIKSGLGRNAVFEELVCPKEIAEEAAGMLTAICGKETADFYLPDYFGIGERVKNGVSFNMNGANAYLNIYKQ